VRVRSASGERDLGSTESNLKGEFDLGMAPVGTLVQVGFSKAGYGRQQLSFTGRAGDAQSLGTVTLGTGRTLVVVVTAEGGAPFVPLAGTEGVGSRPELRFFGENVWPSAQGSGPGEWLFTDLPSGQLRFVLMHRGGDELQEWTITTTETRVALPLDREVLGHLRSAE